MNLGLSVCRLPLNFLGIGQLFFSETQHGGKGPCRVARNKAAFFGKNHFWAKMTKNLGFWTFF